MAAQQTGGDAPDLVLCSRETLAELAEHIEAARDDDPAVRAANLDMADDCLDDALGREEGA